MRNFKKIDELIFDITKQIFKRHDKNFLTIQENWESLVGKKFYSLCKPKKINKYDVLIVNVKNPYLLDLQYKSDEIVKKINALLKSKTICKIRLIIKN